MKRDLTYVINDEIEVNDVDDKAVIIEPSGEEIYVLNKEEKEILQLFNGVNTLMDINRKLGEEYGDEYVADEFFLYAESLLGKGILVEGNSI